MATRLSVATGNFTAAGTWGLCDATSELDSEAATVTLSTSNTDSTAFTPGAITVDGVAVKLRTRASSPSGTMTVTLRNSTAGSDVASVTINISDLPVNALDSSGNPLVNGWIFFKFGSSQLLLAATNYLIRAATSANSQVTLYGSTTTNMSRQLRTTTTGAPGASDKLLVSGELTGAGALTSFTVTMDETASTVYGTEALTQSLVVSLGGTLTWGTTASTAYLLTIAGKIIVATGGTWNQGTSGTRVPSSSSATLQFSVTTNLASGISVHGGTMNAYGDTGRLAYTTITSDAASGQPVVNVAAVTGWQNNDNVCLSATARVVTQGENKIIQSIASLAVTMTANLTNAHHGSAALAPNAGRGHVGNLTRNVKILGTDNTHRYFIFLCREAVCSLDYVEMQFLGGVGNIGIQWTGSTGAKSITNCSIWQFRQVLVQSTDWGNFTFTGNVCYLGDAGVTTVQLSTDTTLSNWIVSNNLICAGSATPSLGLRIGSVLGTVSGNITVGNSDGLILSCVGNASVQTGTFSDNEQYCNATSGLELTATGLALPINFTISGNKSWRNTGRGITFAGAFPVVGLLIDDPVCFGNTSSNIHVNSTLGAYGVVIRDGVFNGETGFATARGLVSQTAHCDVRIRFETCTFGVTTDHTTADLGYNGTSLWQEIHLINCILDSATPIETVARYAVIKTDTSIFNTAAPSERVTPATTPTTDLRLPIPESFIRCQRYGQTDGDHRSFVCFGPTGVKTRSSPKIKAANDGQAITVSVAVRKSAAGDGTAYTGNQPRLIMKRNPAVGLAADVVLDTMSVGTGSWETLTGTTAALTDDGAVEFYVDCDGLGWINVDDWLLQAA